MSRLYYSTGTIGTLFYFFMSAAVYNEELPHNPLCEPRDLINALKYIRP